MDASTPVVPSMWTGIALEVDTIAMGRNVINAQVRDMAKANRDRELAALKIAIEKISDSANQMKTMADHLSGMIARHQNRRPRP